MYKTNGLVNKFLELLRRFRNGSWIYSLRFSRSDESRLYAVVPAWY
jgi:hypothetical protein